MCSENDILVMHTQAIRISIIAPVYRGIKTAARLYLLSNVCMCNRDDACATPIMATGVCYSTFEY